MTKQETVQNVADKLFATEEALDVAMVRAAQLLEGMIQARTTLRVSTSLTEVAQVRTVEAMGALSEAHRAIMAAHAALDNVQHKLGTETIAGIVIKEDDGNTQPAPSGSLRVAS